MGCSNSVAVQVAPASTLSQLLSRPHVLRTPTKPTTDQEALLIKRYEDYGGDDAFKTGDVFAFSSYADEGFIKDAFNNLERRLDGVPYTHIGLIVRPKIAIPQGTLLAPPFIVEGTVNTELSEDVVIRAGKGRRGVWTFLVRDRLLDIDAQVWHYRLKNPLSEEASHKLEMFVLNLYLKDPKYGVKAMLKCGLDSLANEKLEKQLLHDIGLENAKDDYSTIFCSELAAGALKAAGLLPEEHNCSTTTPKDVATFPFLELSKQLKHEGESNSVSRMRAAAKPGKCLGCCG